MAPFIKNLAIVCFFSLSMVFAFAQNPMNQVDDHGKKHGKCIEYFDAKWKTVSNESKAVYYRYTEFYHGFDMYQMFNTPWINATLECSRTTSQNEKVKMLDGEYTWKDKQGKTIAVYTFNKGELVAMKDFTWKKLGSLWLGHFLTETVFGYRNKLTGTLHQFTDYSKKYQGELYTYYTEIYNPKGTQTPGYFREGKGGWAIYDVESMESKMASN